MKQTIKEFSYPQNKPKCNFHLEIINTVKKKKNPKQFHSIQQDSTLETNTTLGKSDTLKASQIHRIFLTFHYEFALKPFKQLLFT